MVPNASCVLLSSAFLSFATPPFSFSTPSVVILATSLMSNHNTLFPEDDPSTGTSVANANLNPRSFYRWNPYGGDSVRDETLKGLVIPIMNDDIDPSQWLFESCPPEAMPPYPIPIFIGQMFNPEPKRVLAVVASTTGVRMYSPKVMPKRGMFATVLVAREDAPKLLRLNKKMQCEVTPSGERVVRIAALEDGDEICPPLAQSTTERRTSGGVPHSPMVIELSVPYPFRSRSPSCSKSSDSGDSPSSGGTAMRTPHDTNSSRRRKLHV